MKKWDDNLSLGRDDWKRLLPVSSPLEAEAAHPTFYQSGPATTARHPSSTSVMLNNNETHSLAARISAIASARDSVSSMAKQLISGQPYYEPPVTSAAGASAASSSRSDHSFDAEIDSELNSIRAALAKAQFDTENSGRVAMKRIQTISTAPPPPPPTTRSFSRLSSLSVNTEGARLSHDFSTVDSIKSYRSSVAGLPLPPPPPSSSSHPLVRSTQSENLEQGLSLSTSLQEHVQVVFEDQNSYVYLS